MNQTFAFLSLDPILRWCSRACLLGILLLLAGVKGMSQGRFSGGNGSGYNQFQTSAITTASPTLSEINPEVLIYPQPARKWINIRGFVMPNSEARLYDQQGRTRFRGLWEGDALMLPELSPGLYFLELSGRSYKLMITD